MRLLNVNELKPYPEMKDSGVPRLGQVPEHWTVERLKSSVANIVEQNTERRQRDIYLALEHVESWTGRLKSADLEVPSDSQLKRFESDDVLFGKLRPYLAKVTRPANSGLCVGEFIVLRPRNSKFASSYVEQLLRSKPVIDVVDSSTFGAKMPRADWSGKSCWARNVAPKRIPHPPDRRCCHWQGRRARGGGCTAGSGSACGRRLGRCNP